MGGVIGVMVYIFYYNKQYTKLHHELAPRSVPPEVRLKPLLFAAPALAVYVSFRFPIEDRYLQGCLRSGFFWVAWTSFPSISIASPILAICLIGSAILFVFLGCFNYLIDWYVPHCIVKDQAGADFIVLQLPSKRGLSARDQHWCVTLAPTHSIHPLIFVVCSVPIFLWCRFPALRRSKCALAHSRAANPTDVLLTVYRKLGTPGASSLLGGLAVVFVPVPFLLMKYGKKIRGMSKNAIVRENE